MIKDGEYLNHEYFLVKKGGYWSENQDKALIRGLHIFGVGKWGKIMQYELGEQFVFIIVNYHSNYFKSLRQRLNYVPVFCQEPQI